MQTLAHHIARQAPLMLDKRPRRYVVLWAVRAGYSAVNTDEGRLSFDQWRVVTDEDVECAFRCAEQVVRYGDWSRVDALSYLKSRRENV